MAITGATLDRAERDALRILLFLERTVGTGQAHEQYFIGHGIHPATLDRLEARGLVERHGRGHAYYGRPWRLTDRGLAVARLHNPGARRPLRAGR